eukprot:g727.t1
MDPSVPRLVFLVATLAAGTTSSSPGPFPAGVPGSSEAVPFAPQPCGPGRYAVDDLRPEGGGRGGVPHERTCALCPEGRYGSGYGLRSAACSGVCARGHWCPAGSTGPRERPCPAGRFGASLGLATPACSGACREGYWCPERSLTDTHAACGAVYLFCPRGSAVPVQVSPGHYTIGGNDEYTMTSQRICEPGYFCAGVAAASSMHPGSPEFRGHGNGLNSSAREAQRAHPGGIRRECPPGTFGSISGLETVACSGPCPAGFYCPKRTVVPTRCPAGRYGSPADANQVTNTSTTGAPWTGDNVAPLNDPRNVVSYSIGLSNPSCSAGRYGNVTGLRTADCSPLCHGIDDTGEALLVASLEARGARGGGSNDVGSFAAGSYICPSGSESLCEPGYYCPVGSTSSFMKPCGSDSPTQHECGDERYVCPVGSGPIGSGAPQERSLRPYSGAGGIECDPDSSFYGECPTNTIEASHSSFSYGDDRFDPFAAPSAI